MAMPADVVVKSQTLAPAAGRKSGLFAHGDKRWFSALIGLVLAVLVLPPLLFLVHGAVTVTAPGGATTFSLHRFGDIVAQRGFAQSAINSFIFSLGSAVLALVMGGVMAWLVERTNTPFKPLAYLTTIISMGTPYVLYVSAWLLLLATSILPFVLMLPPSLLM
jgi:iron(III) transport system permease protein